MYAIFGYLPVQKLALMEVDSSRHEQELRSKISFLLDNPMIDTKRYRTELCRQFDETGCCQYGPRCHYAHGHHELRMSLHRHPKFKTDKCTFFHGDIGFCAFGPRCSFVHEVETVEDILAKMSLMVKTPMPENKNPPLLADLMKDSSESVQFVAINAPLEAVDQVVTALPGHGRMAAFSRIAP